METQLIPGRTLAAACLAVLLCACGRAPANSAEPAQTPPAQIEYALPAAASNEAPRFVGLWAVSQRMCADPAWRFRSDGVSTLGEVSCDFDRVEPTPGGYRVAATCSAEAPPAPYQIRFTVAESAQTMTVEGGPWVQATNLVYCGPLAG